MKKLKLFFACLLMAVLSIGQVWAGEVTISPTQALNSGGVSPISTVCAKGDGTSAPAISSGELRLYQAASGKTTGNTISFSSEKTITKIVFDFTSGKTASNGSFSEGSYDDATMTWTGSATSLTLTVTGTTSGTRIYIKGMTVTYDDGGGSTPTPSLSVSPSVIDFGTVDQNAVVANKTVAVTFENLTGSVTYDGLSGAFSASGSISATGDEITISANTATVGEYSQTLTVQSAADSKSQDVTVKMNVVEPFDGSVLEIVKGDFTNTSYDDNAGDHEKSGITFTTAKVYQSGGGIQFQKTNGLLYNKTDLGEIAKIEITTVSGKSNNLVVYSGTTENPTSGAVSGSASGSVTTYTFAAGKGFFAIKCNSTGASNVDPIKVYYTPATPSAVDKPTISGDENFVTSTTVTLACSTTGADIYYTTDGSDPKSGTIGTSFSLTETATVRAIAKLGSDWSAEATPMTFTKIEALTTMDAIFAAATTAGTTATDVAITFNNWVVSGAKGNTAYVTDGTKGFIVYYSDHGFQEGDILSGTAIFTIKLYNGAAEVTAKLSGTVTATTGGTAQLNELDGDAISVLSGINTGSLIKISGEATAEDVVAGVTLYKTIYPESSLPSLTVGHNYNCTGVYVQYNSTKEMMPRKVADIEEVTEEGAPETPTFSVAAGEYTAVQTVELSCATDGATIYYTTDGSTPSAGSTEYTAAIAVDATMTIKAIAVKDELSSAIASAAYIINLPADPETTCTWDLSTTSYVADPEPTADLIQWTSTYVTMKAEKNGGGTGVNNYIPPTRTSTRFYTSNKITFIPANSKQITTIVITAASSGYATALKNATWTNGSAAAGSSDTEVIVTASGSGNVVCVLGSNTGITAVTVNYEPYVAPATYAVSFAAPEHGSLAIANGEDPISSGDEFVAGTELTVTAEPASGYVLDAIKVIETGSDPENDVTSTVLDGATLTVPAFAITVSATFVENVAPAATLTLSENGVPSSLAGEHHQGDVVNLPLTSSAECVKEFVGWSANASCAVAPEYAPGAEYTLASTEQTLYAVYATASGSSYVKTALASIASGSEVVVTEAKTVEEVLTTWALTYNTTSKKTIASVVTESENVLDVAGLTNGFWILTKDGANFSLTAKGTTDKLYCTATNDGVRVGEGENNLFSINSDYMYNNGTTRFIGVQGAVDWRCYTSINSTISGQTLAFYKKTATYSDYATTCVAALAAPEFTPAGGVYTEAKSIVITAEEGTIYYTLDGTDPTSGSTEYTAPIVLDANGTTTIKAIAISATSQSAIASATYTINMPLSTIQAVYDKAVEVGSTATEVNIAFNNWVVSGISTDNKNVYVTDGEKGFVIYDSEADHGFAVNDKLNGTVATSLKLYNKFADVIGLKANAEGLTVTHDGVITPVAATIADLGAVNTGAPIILNGVLFDGSALSDGVNSITPYTTFYADAVTSLESDKYYNITGIYVHFNNTKEIAPRSAADIVESVLVDPEISYDPESETIEVADIASWSAPSLINEHGVTIASYASDNEEVATVTDGGVISLAGGTGTAHITAHSNATSTYAAGNAIYTITVNAPAPTPSGTTYRKVTATEDITDGEYLIVYETSSVAFDGSLETLDAVGNTVDVTINEGVIAGTAAIDAAVFTIDVTAGSIKSASNKYIGVSSYSNGLSVSDDADAFENALSIDADGNAVIVITTSGGDMTLRYNSASNQIRFRYYKNAGQQPIQLYKKETAPEPVYTDIRTGLTAGNYFTVCWPKEMTAIKGATLWSFAGKDDDMAYLIQEEAPFEAGKPFIAYATSEKLEAVVEGDDADAGSNNGLYGTLVNMTNEELLAAGATYMLKDNALRPVGGGHLNANRAYVILSEILGGAPAQAPGRNIRKMPMQKDQAQGFESVEASEKPMKLMIDGKMYILRGEKMYDATGRLVK